MAAVKTPLLGASGGDSVTASTDGTTKNQLGTVMGVIVPVLCAMWGAILFLRLPWSVGQAGVLGGLLTFGVAGLTVLLTVLSIAAVSTSGQMGAGGAYYIISRTLGMEAGGSIGIVFFAANSVGITFYLVALATEIDSLAGGDGNPWRIKLYASAALLALLIVSLVGASFFTKLNAVVLVLMVISIIAAAVSFLMGNSSTYGHTGPSLQTLSDNLLFSYSTDDTGSPMNFFSVLIIIFPAMTGVMAGANMSGDLKNPGESIGVGTLWAVAIASAVYALLIVVIGASVERDALQNNVNIMQDVCFWPPLVAIGLVASTVSSALGNLVGSGRILQALARDKLFPGMSMFKWGTKKGDEPIPATLLAWAIAQACVFIGSLDAVAAIISGFFLIVYWAVNASCLLMRVAGAPNFRPKFRYFSWHTALAGVITCLAVLFLSSAVYASISIVIVFCLFIYVGYTADNTEWGDVTQALIFHQVRKYLLRLDERKLHPKNWRPSLLVCVQDPSSRSALHLIDFANNLKKGGLYVLGHAVLGDLGDVGGRLQPLRHAWLDFIASTRVKAFAEIVVAPSARVAYQNLVLCSGLGGLKPNTILLCLPDNFSTVFDRDAAAMRLLITSSAATSAAAAAVSGTPLGSPMPDSGSAVSDPHGRMTPVGIGHATSRGTGDYDLLTYKTKQLGIDEVGASAGVGSSKDGKMTKAEARRAEQVAAIAAAAKRVRQIACGVVTTGAFGVALSDSVAHRGGAVLRRRHPVAGSEDDCRLGDDDHHNGICGPRVGALSLPSAAARRPNGFTSPLPAGDPTASAVAVMANAASSEVTTTNGAAVAGNSRASIMGVELGRIGGDPEADGKAAASPDAPLGVAGAAASEAVAAGDDDEANGSGQAMLAKRRNGKPHPASASDAGGDEEEAEDADFAGAAGAGGSGAGRALSAAATDSVTPARSAQEYMDIVRDCLFLGRNVLLTRWFSELDKSLIVSFAATARKERIVSEASRLRIDVWTSSRHAVDPQGALLLAVQLADVLHRTDVWASCTALRVCSIVETPEEELDEVERLSKFIRDYRYDADIRVVSMLGRRARPVVSELHHRNTSLPRASRIDVMGDASCINEVIRHHCEQTCVLFSPLPEPIPPAQGAFQTHASDPRLSTDAAYLQYIDLMTRGLPPTVLVGSSGLARFVTTDL